VVDRSVPRNAQKISGLARVSRLGAEQFAPPHFGPGLAISRVYSPEVSEVSALALVALSAWSLAGVLLWWGRLPGPWRRSLALLTSGAGIVFLVVGMRSEGVREAATTAAFLIGPSYVTEQATASASLPYYVLTGVCLLLGTLGLAVGDDLAQTLRQRWMTAAVVISLSVTALRFCLDKVAAPQFLVAVMGVVWLPPIVGAFFAQNVRAEGRGLGSLVGALFGYALVVRGGVALLMVLASVLRLGSHYDVSPILEVHLPFSHRLVHFEPGSLRQVLDLAILPQLLFWTSYTVITGLLGATVLYLLEIVSGTGAPAPAPPAPQLAAAGKDR
jgi:hypothetical protein